MPNRLALEASPYLLQHADNPVDWYPWGPEALDRARREDKPILLSIGYAACHWCHVMEHESFEDPDIARLMNERFINIKVDREERPDLDQIYQLTVQLMRQSGGWPLTVFLTPLQRPFYAGTYFPPRDKHGMPGFPRVLHALSEAYATKRADVDEQAAELTAAIGEVGLLRSPNAHKAGAAPDGDVLRLASSKLMTRVDAKYGGFGGRPKFPNTMALEVLLRRGVLEGDRPCAEAAMRALDRMREGGIWDHLRGGFHRYSTDERWLVPHFEKMLYDNALLLRLYVDAWRALRKPLYAETAREIVGYLFAEMRDPSGAFYASQDADSEGEEGKFFVWTLADLNEAVGGRKAHFDVARLAFGIDEVGNFEHSGATVLHTAKTLEAVAKELGIDGAQAEETFLEAKREMLAWRERRPRPTRDDKVLASWNGLLIGALAHAGRALDEALWVEAAEKAFVALEDALVRSGRVGRYVKDGAPWNDRAGFLDDQAYFGNAALDLYEATGEARYASVARAICGTMIDFHWDREQGGFFFAPRDGDTLIARTKDNYDQAIPAPAAMAALLCLRIGEIADAAFTSYGEKQLVAAAGSAVENPFGMGQTVLALHRLVRGSTDVVIVGAGAGDGHALSAVAFHRYVPNLALVTIDPARPGTIAAAPLAAEGKAGRPAETVAYVCKGRSCSLPVADAKALDDLLAG